MKNKNGNSTLLIGLSISIILITAVAVYKSEIVSAYVTLEEQHPGFLRAAVPLILFLAVIMAFIKSKK